jgi:beta-lactamase superfamily II metal-dependent hydrolase
LSTCLKITYGRFDYFTGGDISGIDAFGQTDINSLESNVAPVIGPVDIATLNHHGNRDSQNVFFVKTIRPRIWIQQNWSSDHPGDEVLRRITSKTLYPGERDLFSTVMLQPNKDVIGDKLNQYKSQNGHIVVRVYDQGSKYDIYILNDDSKEREIKAKYGPYEAR